MRKICKARCTKLLTAALMFITVLLGMQVIGITDASAASVAVLNGGFEDESNNKPLNWTVLDDVDCMDGNTVVDTEHHDGYTSLKIADTSGTLCSGVRSEAIPAIAGHSYESTVYCYVYSGSATFYLEFWNSGGTRISAESDVLNTTGSWQQMEVSGTAPAGTTSITLLCYSLVGNVGTSYYDTVTLDDNGMAPVPNYSFENADGNNNPTDWTILDDVDCMDGNSVSTDRAYSGSKSLKIADTSSSLCSGVRSEAISASEEHFYESTVYCYLDSGAISYYLEFWDSGDTRISEEHVVHETGGSWELLEVSGTAPSGTTYITLLCYSTLSNIGTSYFDVVTLDDNGMLMPNGDMETSYANAVDGTPMKFGDPTEWEFDMEDNTDDAYKSDTYTHNGSYSLCLDDSSASTGIALRSSYFKASAGTSYTANAYLYNYSGAGSIYVEFWNSSKTRIGTGSYVLSGTGSWQKVSATATAPANTVALTVLLYSSVSNTGESYFDDVSIEGLTSLKYAYSTDIASKKQFFADNYIIESMSNLTRTVNQGTKLGTQLVQPQYAWEGVGTGNTTLQVGTVLYNSEESIYEMWYLTSYNATSTYYTCYAHSSDGTTWIKPDDLGLVSFGGNTNNNIVRSDLGAPSVFWDYDINCDSDEKYKIYACKGSWNAAGQGYYIFYSSDDPEETNEWTLPYPTPIFAGSSYYRDVCTAAYDAVNSKYISINKYWPSTSVTRVMHTATSTDFESWGTAELSFACDAEDRTTYDSTDVYGISLYPTEGVYFGLPWILYYDYGDPDDDGPVDAQFAFSRDAYNWVRPSRSPVIPLGAGWEAGQIYPASYPIEIGDKVRWYYSGWSHTHAVDSTSSAISYAEWRRDGFVSLNAGGTEGILTTKPVKFAGNNTLLLNVDASGGGSVKVEILDSDDNVITGFSKDDCDTITTDSVNYTVTWDDSSSISSLAGQDIKFKIYMTNAELYALKTTTPITIQAEDYDSMSGISNAGTAIGYCDNGDWVCFDDVDLKNGYSQLISRVAVDNAYAGQTIEVRLDDPEEGQVIGTLTVQGTGGWTSYEEQSITLNSTACGTHDIYIFFKGGSSVGNFDWFVFK